jgi:hypothetical protein
MNWIKTSERLKFVATIQSSVTDLVQQYELIAMYDAKQLPPLPEEQG